MIVYPALLFCRLKIPCVFLLPDLQNDRAATVPAASKLARITGAKVVFCVTEMTETGYITHISKPLENFPTTDAIADTRRIQKEIERWVLQFPDQYFWMHRRFKTRPLGEKSLYEP